MPYAITVLGTAGSGKSTLTASLAYYLLSKEMDVAIINLDPAVDTLPYKPDIDVREIVDAYTLMREQGLGPNGALVAAIDVVALNADRIKEEMSSLRANYLIIDTPGQMEIFAFRESGPITLNILLEDIRSVVLFLIDASFAFKASSFLSALLLASSTYFRIKQPQILVLNKVDLLTPENLGRIYSYMEDPYFLANELQREGYIGLWSTDEIIDLVDKLRVFNIIYTSSIKLKGFDELYASIQRVLAGGEDYYTEEPSGRL